MKFAFFANFIPSEAEGSPRIRNRQTAQLCALCELCGEISSPLHDILASSANLCATQRLCVILCLRIRSATLNFKLSTVDLFYLPAPKTKKAQLKAAPIPISVFQFPVSNPRLQFTIFLNESNASLANAYRGSIDSDC